MPPGVLTVDPERRHTGVLVGVTLLAVLVGTTTVATGVARLGEASTSTETYAAVEEPLTSVQDARLEGGCDGATASGTWSLPYDAPAVLTVVLLTDAGEALGRAQVADDGTWTVPRVRTGSVTAVLLQEAFGPVTSARLDGC